jgi:hypothetical protein
MCAWLYRGLSFATDILWGTQQIDAVAQASASATNCYVTCQDVALVCVLAEFLPCLAGGLGASGLQAAS